MKNSYPLLLLSYLGIHPLLLAANYAGFEIPGFLSSANLLALHVVAAVFLFGLQDYAKAPRRTRALALVAGLRPHVATETAPRRANAYGIPSRVVRKKEPHCAAL